MDTMKKSYNFALIGASGYVAPRHLKAIKDTGNKLVSALDPNDSVGILDSYFSSAAFFTEFERFDRHAEKLRRQGDSSRIDYVSICSPNYLHDAHIRFALRIGADAVCEKPLVLNPWNLDALSELESETGKRVYTILQLRYNNILRELKETLSKENSEGKHQVVLTYVTPRGNWYGVSWKGRPEKSGGIVTNIGIHLFDLLLWLFGKVKTSEVHYLDHQYAGGYLELEKADIKWFLSLDSRHLPAGFSGKSFRSIEIDGRQVDFTDGFTDLHTEAYKGILEGNGLGIKDSKPSIDLTYSIRTTNIIGSNERSHPLLIN